MLNTQCSRQLAHHAISEMGRVVAYPRGWRPKRGTLAHKLFDGAIHRARSRLSQPCVSTHILEDDQDVLKSARSVNAGVHRTLSCRDNQNAQLRSALAHEWFLPASVSYTHLTLPTIYSV